MLILLVCFPECRKFYTVTDDRDMRNSYTLKRLGCLKLHVNPQIFVLLGSSLWHSAGSDHYVHDACYEKPASLLCRHITKCTLHTPKHDPGFTTLTIHTNAPFAGHFTHAFIKY